MFKIISMRMGWQGCNFNAIFSNNWITLKHEIFWTNFCASGIRICRDKHKIQVSKQNMSCSLDDSNKSKIACSIKESYSHKLHLILFPDKEYIKTYSIKMLFVFGLLEQTYLCDESQLMNIIFSRKQRLSCHDFTKYATYGPDINCSGIFWTI